METMAEISAAISQINTKKQNLQKSFLHLQSQSPSSFNLPLSWSDIDSYFTNLQSSLQSKFNLLQTLHPSPATVLAPTRPELKSFCQNSDGLGLTRFIIHALDQEDKESISSGLVSAYRFAPDAGAMVLDVIVGFYRCGCEGIELGLFRSGCLIMLEGLVRVKPVVSVEVKDKAMEIAVQWNQKRVCSDGAVEDKEQNVLGFLLLIEAYGLVDRFSIDEIIDCLVATDQRTVDLCRRIVPQSNINDMIQKLIDKDKHVAAVNFSIDLKKTDRFSPVGLLEERKLKSLRVIEDARKNVKDLHVCNDVITKEINTLKSIIECIEANHLQSEYPKDSVVELVNKLENEVENRRQTLVNNLQLRKQSARAAVLKKQLRAKSQMLKKSKKLKLKKVQLTVESAAAVTSVETVKLVQEFRSQKSDLSPDHLGDCHNTPLGSDPTGSNTPYACHNTPPGSGPTGSDAPHASSSASLDGPTRADTGYNFYVKQLQPPSDCNSNGWISD